MYLNKFQISYKYSGCLYNTFFDLLGEINFILVDSQVYYTLFQYPQMNIVKKNITKCKIVNKVRDQYMYIIIQFKKSKGRGVLTRNVSLYLNRPITFCQ